MAKIIELVYNNKGVWKSNIKKIDMNVKAPDIPLQI